MITRNSVWWIFALVYLFFSFNVFTYPQDPAEEGGEVGGGENAIEPEVPVTEAPSDVPLDVPSDELTTAPYPCNVVGLIRCFTDRLDDWMLYLWNFKDNIVTINESACANHKEMDYCATYPSCSKSEILNASKAITDLILHRQNSGSFLKSYFFTTFACTDEGQEIVKVHRKCLQQNRVNPKSLYLSHYMETTIECLIRTNKNFTHCGASVEASEIQDEDWYCGFLKVKANDLYTVVKEDCATEPAYLMCRSLKDIFVNLFPELLENCQVPCAEKPDVVSSESQNGVLSSTTKLASTTIYEVSTKFKLLVYLLSSLVTITCRVN